MRISTLLEREPFGEILEETLGGFLESWKGQPRQVFWYAGRPDLAAMRRRGQQPWLCNVYLNAIFAPEADPRVLEPVQREFSRSVTGWRRPAQRAYVALASSRWGARWLAQAGVGISPGLPDADQLLIVAGNHKIRLLDRAEGVVYGVRKCGFPPGFMQRETETRRQAEALGLPVPPLEEVAEGGSWFRERYVVGTPVNRLTDGAAMRQAVGQVAQALHRLLGSTMQEEPLHEYAGRLAEQARALVEASCLLNEKQKQSLERTIEGLLAQIQAVQPEMNATILTALTHGDFQPANIIANGSAVWLIDWEYTGRRQAAYDALTFGLHSRFPSGLAERMGSELAGVLDSAVAQLGPWPGLDWGDGTAKRVHLGLFLLEELTLHLEENANTRFAKIGDGLGIVLKEADTWLEGADNG
jgi:aminoglycoside phosphotransferase